MAMKKSTTVDLRTYSLHLLLVSIFILTTTTVFAANPNNNSADKKLLVAPHYQALKNRIKDSDSVQIIATYKEFYIGRTQAHRRALARESLKAFHRKKKFSAKKIFNHLPFSTYAVSDTELDALIDSGLISHIEEDKPHKAILNQSIPFVGADTAHNNNITGTNVAVAILDTGLDLDHSAFAGRIVEEACFSDNFNPQQRVSLCPNGQDEQFGTGSAAACTNDSQCFHGTHVGSIATGNNGTFGGVAPSVSIIAIQVFTLVNNSTICDGNSSCALAFTSDIIKGMDHVASLSSSHTIAAINLSLGSGEFFSACDNIQSSFKTAVDNLKALDIATVIASGNDGHTNAVASPACISTAITVGSVGNANNNVSSFSNSGLNLIDYLAPGENIAAAFSETGGFASTSGTSMAAPHVTGAFALIKQLYPSFSVDQIDALLSANSVDVIDSRNSLTFERIDIGQVINSQMPALTITAPNNLSTINIGTAISLTANATDPQDGDLSNSVNWNSNLDGVITSPATLSLGTHTLTASVTDTQGFIATSNVNVTVANPPTTTILAPANASQFLQSETINLIGSASDPEDGDISANINWSSNIDNLLGTSASINADLSAGIHTITASVTDSDGAIVTNPATIQLDILADADADGIDDAWETLFGIDLPGDDPDSDTLTNLEEYIAGSNPIDAAPTVTIITPITGAEFSESATITLTGSANDTEDGNVSALITWASSLDGIIGTDASINTSTLNLGTHTISATVTDSQGAAPVSIPSIEITIDTNDGDINNDGILDIRDLLMLEQYLTNSRTLNAGELIRADVHPADTGDEQLTIEDLLFLRQLLLL